jgi:hypothetical protein
LRRLRTSAKGKPREAGSCRAGTGMVGRPWLAHCSCSSNLLASCSPPASLASQLSETGLAGILQSAPPRRAPMGFRGTQGQVPSTMHWRGGGPREAGRGDAERERPDPCTASPRQAQLPERRKARCTHTHLHTHSHALTRSATRGTKTRAPTLRPAAPVPRCPGCMYALTAHANGPGHSNPHGRAPRGPRTRVRTPTKTAGPARRARHPSTLHASAGSHRLPRVLTPTPRSVTGGPTRDRTTPRGANGGRWVPGPAVTTPPPPGVRAPLSPVLVLTLAPHLLSAPLWLRLRLRLLSGLPRGAARCRCRCRLGRGGGGSSRGGAGGRRGWDPPPPAAKSPPPPAFNPSSSVPPSGAAPLPLAPCSLPGAKHFTCRLLSWPARGTGWQRSWTRVTTGSNLLVWDQSPAWSVAKP